MLDPESAAGRDGRPENLATCAHRGAARRPDRSSCLEIWTITTAFPAERNPVMSRSGPMRMTSLATRLVLFVTGSILVTALVLSWIAIESSREHLQSQLVERYNQHLEALAERTREWFEENQAALAQFSPESDSPAALAAELSSRASSIRALAILDAAAGKAQVTRTKGIEQEQTPIYDLARRYYPALAAICETFHGLHLPHTSSVFEALILAILGQQIATNVARIVRTLLIETYGLRQAFDGVDYYAFPRPEALASASVEDLRQLKLTYRKAEYVQGIARAARDGTGGLDCLNEKSDEDVVQQITQLRGVGKWTAQWVLVRGLGRPDALPLGDLALRRVVSSLYFEGEPITDEQLGPFSARWSPWRTYATVYLFSALRAGMV